MEPTRNQPGARRRGPPAHLLHARRRERFEQFLHTKYVGQKRFSLEGAEALIPHARRADRGGRRRGVEEIVIAMAHRGRLNVLANTLRKPYETIFAEFEGTLPAGRRAGRRRREVPPRLLARPRHARRPARSTCRCCPTRATWRRSTRSPRASCAPSRTSRDDADGATVMPLLIHGDAAFTGQGHRPRDAVAVRARRLPHRRHDPRDRQQPDRLHRARPRTTASRATPSDIAKIIQAPVFHVNGDDPEAAVHAARLAIAFRRQFKDDVIIDLVCYRRHGHNEADDPTFTQPLMYAIIDRAPTGARDLRRAAAAEPASLDAPPVDGARPSSASCSRTRSTTRATSCRASRCSRSAACGRA